MLKECWGIAFYNSFPRWFWIPLAAHLVSNRWSDPVVVITCLYYTILILLTDKWSMIAHSLTFSKHFKTHLNFESNNKQAEKINTLNFIKWENHRDLSPWDVLSNLLRSLFSLFGFSPGDHNSPKSVEMTQGLRLSIHGDTSTKSAVSSPNFSSVVSLVLTCVELSIKNPKALFRVTAPQIISFNV